MSLRGLKVGCELSTFFLYVSVELSALDRTNEKSAHDLAEVEEKFPRDAAGAFEDDPDWSRSLNES